MLLDPLFRGVSRAHRPGADDTRCLTNEPEKHTTLGTLQMQMSKPGRTLGVFSEGGWDQWGGLGWDTCQLLPSPQNPGQKWLQETHGWEERGDGSLYVFFTVKTTSLNPKPALRKICCQFQGGAIGDGRRTGHSSQQMSTRQGGLRHGQTAQGELGSFPLRSMDRWLETVFIVTHTKPYMHK